MVVSGVDILQSANERVLACIGVNDIEVARLRLLMRVASPRLKASWRIGPADRADMLVLAPGSDAAEQAALQAHGRGVRCVVLGGRRGGVDTLPQPFEADDVVAMLNAGHAASTTPLELLDSESPEFFLHGMHDGPARGEPGHHRGSGEGERQELVDMDRLFARDPLAARPDVERRPPAPSSSEPSATDRRLDEVVPGVPRRDAPARRSESPAEPARRNPFLDEPVERSNPFLDTPGTGSGASASSSHSWSLQEKTPSSGSEARKASSAGAGHPLADYLGSERLVGPSRIQLPGEAELIVDPKHGVYHIEGDLQAAEAYVRQPLDADAWRPLTNTQLARVRQAIPARPYMRLKWLSALRAADGYLPRHLDPGGTYWLREVLDLDAHYATCRRIGQALLQAHPLHEVMRLANVSMHDVFDTVAAYDAVGLVHFRPRERLR